MPRPEAKPEKGVTGISLACAGCNDRRVAIERYRRQTRKAIEFGTATEDTNPLERRICRKPTSNQGLQATAYSFRSCVAPASCRA
jgi:hypothetical protein